MAGPYLFPPIGGAGNPAWPWNYQDGIPFIDFQAHKQKALLLKVEVKDSTNALTFGVLPPSGGLEGVPWSWRGAVTTLWPGATTAKSTKDDDIPPAQWVNDALETSVNFGRSLFRGADPRNNATQTQGEISLLDPQGDLEYLFDYAWDGAKLTIFRGDEDAYFLTYGVVAVFTSAALLGDLEYKQIRTRDSGWKLGGLIHDERYMGTGGMEGTNTNKGKWKPYALGWFFGAEPVPVDPTNEVSQWSFAPTDTVSSVTHGGVPITVAADYATYAELIAAAIPVGQCATCKAVSAIRTNFDIEFGIRIAGLGDANNLSGHATPEIRAEIARRVATGYGESKLNEATDIDLQSFSKVGQDHPAECGYWWNSETTKADALNEIMLGILGYWHVKPSGQLAIGYTEAPTILDSFSDVEYGDYGMGEVRLVDESMPWAACHVTWRRNYMPQARDQLAGSVLVDEVAASILGEPYSTAVSEDESVTVLYPTAVPVILPGNFLNEEDALENANRIMGIMGVPRKRYQIEMEIDPFADIVDRTARFLNFNRLKMGVEIVLRCVSLESVGFGRTKTDWWG